MALDLQKILKKGVNIMFSLFPCDWSAPKKQKLVDASIQPDQKHFISNYIPKNIASVCPAEEMLKPEEEVDISEIDKMLIRIGMMSS
jgi:hypothetical protein